MSAKLYVATDTVGETKAPAITTGSAEAFVSSPPVTILQDVFKLPDHIPKDMLTEAVKICQLAKERNKYNHKVDAPVWLPDASTDTCMRCNRTFNLLRRRHHCRACGFVVCLACSSKKIKLL